jgi:hypothetical protein
LIGEKSNLSGTTTNGSTISGMSKSEPKKKKTKDAQIKKQGSIVNIFDWDEYALNVRMTKSSKLFKNESKSHVVKGGKRGSCKFTWSQDEKRIVCGLFPRNLTGWKKDFLEYTTLGFVMCSVMLIILQSFPAFNAYCTPYTANSDDYNFKGVAPNTTQTTYNCTLGGDAYKGAQGYNAIQNMQVFLVAWFSIEYFLRFQAVRPGWRVVRPYSWKDFWKAKLGHVLSISVVIDLLAITPFYIEQLVAMSGGDLGGAGTILTVLRLIRVMRTVLGAGFIVFVVLLREDAFDSLTPVAGL